jgi:Zinc finger, C2H2 type
VRKPGARKKIIGKLEARRKLLGKDEVKCVGPGCESSFPRVDEMRNHLRNAKIHEGLSESDLQKLLDPTKTPARQSKGKPYACPAGGCYSSFKDVGGMRRHLGQGRKPARHKGLTESDMKQLLESTFDPAQRVRKPKLAPKPRLVCPTGCQRSFTRPSSLRRHVKTVSHARMGLKKIDMKKSLEGDFQGEGKTCTACG